MTNDRAVVRFLDSGYALVKWSPEIWAQFPRGRACQREDFFHPDSTFTEARAAEATRLADLVNQHG